MRECFVYWSERVHRSWIVTGPKSVLATATAHSCTTFRPVLRLVIVDAQRRFLIRLESLPLSVWTFRLDDHGRYSPHKNGQPFCGRGEMMRTMVLEPVCVDLIEPLFQARVVTITTFSFFPINTGAVISISDGLHASFRVANCFSNCTRKRSCPGRTIPDACLFEKISLKRIATRGRSVCQKERNLDQQFPTRRRTWFQHQAIIETQLSTHSRGAVVVA